MNQNTTQQEDQQNEVGSSKLNPNVNDTNEALSSCLLSQYRFCFGGVGLGAAYGIKYSKGAIPMVAGGLVGSVADLVYGYYYACSKEVNDYNQSKMNQNK